MRYDIVLVYTSFRRHNAYLNIAQQLGRRMRIGLFQVDAKWKGLENTEKEFIAALERFGVERAAGPTECHTLIVPRLALPEVAKKIKAAVSYDRLLLLMSSPSAGMPFLPQVIETLGPATILVFDRRRFGEFEPATLDYLRTHPLETVEIGSPFARYPVYKDFHTDYLLAYPSHVSLTKKWQAYPLLHNVLKALAALPPTAKVAVKPHNAREEGTWVSERGRVSALRPPVQLVRLALDVLHVVLSASWKGRPFYERLSDKTILRIRSLQNYCIFSRCDNVLDRYPAFGIENFICGVRKGVITGLSTTVWEALLQKKAVLNVDDLPKEDRFPNYQTMYRAYGMSEWEGFSEKGFPIIDDSTRKADLMRYLEDTVKKVVHT